MSVCCVAILRSALFGAVLTGAIAHAQVTAAAPPGGPPVPWAAVSIHPSDPARDLSKDGWAGQASGFTAQGATVQKLLSRAYNFGILPFRDDEVEGLPAWARKPRYDVRARVDADDIEGFRRLSDLPIPDKLAAFAARQYTGQMLMIQAMLQERFHLKAHYELRPRAVYFLAVGKGGPHLQPTATATEAGTLSYSSTGHIAAKGVAMVLIANLLAYPAERFVLDRTGLTGRFDFELRFAPTNAGVSAEASTEPDFFSAVREELGLRLESGRADVPVLIVDHIEEPTPN